MEYMPPQDIEAEKAVLASCLIDQTAALEATEKLKPEHFYREDHKIIFDAMISLMSRSENIDPVLVVDELKKTKKLNKTLGLEYLIAIIDILPTSANIVQYINIVKEKYELRTIINTANEMQKLAYDESEEASTILANVQDTIFNLSSERQSKGYEVLREVLVKTYEELARVQKSGTNITGISTGFKALDKKLLGLQPSNLVIIAARPGMGKSALAVNIATHIAVREKRAALIFNMEMSKNDIAKRILSAETLIDNNLIATGKIDGDDRDKMVNILQTLSPAELYIDDTPGINIMEISAKAKKLKMEKDIAVVVVDYLQLIEPIQTKRVQSREQEITQISRSLKKLAMELQIPVIALSQLSRSAERGGKKNEPKKPMLSDLRESGAIEQDADVVLFIYRDEYYNEESENKDIAEVIIAKNRAGTTGSVDLAWLGANTRFMDLAEDEIFFED